MIAVIFVLCLAYVDVIKGDLSAHLFIGLLAILAPEIWSIALDIITSSFRSTRIFSITVLVKIHALEVELEGVFSV